MCYIKFKRGLLIILIKLEGEKMKASNVLEIKKLNFKENKNKILKDFNLKVKKNSIHSILFKNEESKNKLLDFLRAKTEFEKAEIFINGEKINNQQLRSLDRNKIYLINQYSAVNPEKDPFSMFKFNKKGENENHSTVFSEMTIAENIFFGREPLKSFFFFKSINYNKMDKLTAELLSLLEMELYPEQKMVELSPLEKQLVEMLKALSLNLDILLIDQAVIKLSKNEKEIFYNFMEKLKEKGITIIYFTKEIKEVFASSEYVSILKEGENRGNYRVSELEYNQLAVLLMGE